MSVSEQIKMETLKVPLVIGENNVQKVITESLNPDNKVIKIKNLDFIINKVETNILEDKVIVEGIVKIEVFYIGENNLVCYQTFKINFYELINITGVKPGMEVVIKSDAEPIETRLIQKQNVIQQKLFLHFFVKVLDVRELAVNIGKGPLVKSNRIVEKRSIITEIKNEVKPAILAADIINVETQIKNINLNICSNKVIVEAVLHKKLLYLGKDGNEHFQFEDIPFNKFINIPDLEPGMKVEISPEVKIIKSKLKLEGNFIKQEFKIILSLTVIETVQLNILPGSDSLAMFPEVIGENTKQLLKEIIVPLEKKVAEIVEIKTEVKNIKEKALKNKVLVEGAIKSNIFYVAENNCEYHKKTETYFNTLVDITGVREYMNVDVDINVNCIKKELNLDNKIIQKVAIDLFVKISEDVQFNLSEINPS